MKKIKLWVIFLLLIIILPLTSCNSLISLKLNTGINDIYTVNDTKTISLNMNFGENISLNYDINFIYNILPTKHFENGDLTFDIKILSLKIKQSTKREEMVFSTEPNEKELSIAYLKDKGFNLTMDSSSNIKDYSSLGALISECYKNLNNLSDAELQNLSSVLSKDLVLDSITKTFLANSSSNVSLGETWQNTKDYNLLFNLKSNNTITLENADDTSFFLKINSILSPNESSIPNNLNNLNISYIVSGNGNFSYKLSKKNKVPNSYIGTEKLNGEMKINSPGNDFSCPINSEIITKVNISKS